MLKKSRQVRLLFLGGIATGAVTGCGSGSSDEPRITPASVYVNDHHIPGAGYYHAPFHAFFPKPYNFYDASTHQYYHGGQWSLAPYQSVINVSAPTSDAALLAQRAREAVQRQGFGSTSRSYFRGS